jgi:hypothetical protein
MEQCKNVFNKFGLMYCFTDVDQLIHKVFDLLEEFNNWPSLLQL